jgi:hypothetical protein
MGVVAAGAVAFALFFMVGGVLQLIAALAAGDRLLGLRGLLFGAVGLVLATWAGRRQVTIEIRGTVLQMTRGVVRRRIDLADVQSASVRERSFATNRNMFWMGSMVGLANGGAREFWAGVDVRLVAGHRRLRVPSIEPQDFLAALHAALPEQAKRSGPGWRLGGRRLRRFAVDAGNAPREDPVPSGASDDRPVAAGQRPSDFTNP